MFGNNRGRLLYRVIAQCAAGTLHLTQPVQKHVNISGGSRSRTAKFSTLPPPSQSSPTSHKKTRSEDIGDFLSDHGGKLAGVAFAMAAVLIYSYYLSVQDRNAIEAQAEREISLEPYEIQQLRFENMITVEEYAAVLNAFQLHLSNQKKVMYKEFVQQTYKQLGRPIRSGHLMDRLVSNIFMYQRDLSIDHNKSAVLLSENPLDSNEKKALPLLNEVAMPSDLLLVVLELSLGSNVKQRIHSLFELGDLMSPPTDIDKHAIKEDSVKTISNGNV